MRARLILLPSIAVLLLLGAMAAACGDGEEQAEPTPTGAATVVASPTSATEAYFRQVESITEDVDVRSRAMTEQWREDVTSAGSEEERFALSQNLYRELFSLSMEFQQGLEDIEPPEDVQDAHNEFMLVAGDFFDAWADIGDQIEGAQSNAELDTIVGNAEFIAAGERLVEACSTLKGVATAMGVDIDLACAA